MKNIKLFFVFFAFLFADAKLFGEISAVLPDTDAWTSQEDCAERNNRLVTEFLNNKLENSVNHREKYWQRNFVDRESYEKSVDPNRERFKFIIGVRDKRKPFASPKLNATLENSALLGETATHKIYSISWSVFDSFDGEGILLEPQGTPNPNTPHKTIIHIPNSNTTPEQILGLNHNGVANGQIENIGFNTAIDGYRVIIPATVDRNLEKRRTATLTNREYIYRAAFQLGRHIIGYEVQEVLALVDWVKRSGNVSVRVEGFGDGGLIAFYATAADKRIDETVVAGYFNCRNRLCDEPIDRNVFGLLEQFGDAEIATLIAPRKLIIVNKNAPELKLRSEKNGAPGTLVKPDNEIVQNEIARAKKLVAGLIENNIADNNWIVFEPDEVIKPTGNLLNNTASNLPKNTTLAQNHTNLAKLRQENIVNGMNKHTQHLLAVSELTRKNFWQKHNSASPQTHSETIEWYRNYFAKNIIGTFDDVLLPPRPRTRLYKNETTYTIYETELDVFGEVTAYGLLLIPKGLKAGEKLPVVVCQHGLERSPVITLHSNPPNAYNGFSTVLCERGYVVFAPQNLYTLRDKFRFNQRQLNPLGKTLFSIMAPQHQQIINWLKTLSFVDQDKIAFYGLSYGGKTAMRVPPLVNGYCLSICSADFNYWNLKTASTLHDFSYIWSGEYEIFEFDLANTFDYSDMAKLIAPRPFMVERGHLDGVGRDEYIGFEFGKVRYFYDHCLKMPERAEIHWFDNGHIINGTKTYPFIDKFLKNK
ncbi:MAG: hypothetical protein LBJ67_06915 [Planctomycetaceae bacterium]|nr:hypothetical protein [Planctomycetaceae bacterium]